MAAPGYAVLDGPPTKSKVGGSHVWLEYHDSLPKYVSYPCVLNGPVKDLHNHCEELSLQIDSAEEPVQVLLETIAGKGYCDDLAPWIQMHQKMLTGPRRWLSAHSLDFKQYLGNMQSGGTCDGLELWLVSVVMGSPLNIVQQDMMWCSLWTGVDLEAYPTLLLTVYGKGLWCKPVPESVDEASSTQPMPDVVQDALRKRGRDVTQRMSPGTSTPSSHASSTETETELLMEAPQRVVVCPPGAGTAKERICPVCDLVIFSSLALICHLCHEHLDLHSYACTQCGSAFNTMKDLSSHESLIYRAPQVKCHFCTYQTHCVLE